MPTGQCILYNDGPKGPVSLQQRRTLPLVIGCFEASIIFVPNKIGTLR
jgi:hypothetical protein